MATLEILLTKGLPASGKSTWAKHVVTSKGFKRVNKDDLRAMIDASVWSRSNENFILSIRDQIVLEALKKGNSIIVDDTNFEDKHFNRMCEIAQSIDGNVLVKEVYFPISIQEALERNSKREGIARVPDDVIKKMYGSYVKNNVVTERTQLFLKKPRTEKPLSNLPKAIICDLDGTLALIHNRNPYDASRCDETDIINQPVADIVMSMYEKGIKVIFVSGREDKYREQTKRFIEKYLCTVAYDTETISQEPTMVIKPIDYELYMRKSGDPRKDTEVKKEIYEEHIRDKYDVYFVLDDRPSVVRYWRHEAGLTVFQLNDKEF